MKRLMFVCLALALALFSGCAQEIDENSSYVEGLITDPIESYDHASNIVPDGEESEISAEQTLTDGFLVKDKKYTYKGRLFLHRVSCRCVFGRLCGILLARQKARGINQKCSLYNCKIFARPLDKSGWLL